MSDTAHPATPPAQFRATPLDRLDRAGTAAIVRRVLAAHTDKTRVPAAKFSSFI
ncbi:hypothetical protein [Micromonospora tulbaghiae]|uniref:hypothetical protein n=1 Tax=Micromonospora tulbaghiae TaxID=479978 RepID=UPI0033DF5C31